MEQITKQGDKYYYGTQKCTDSNDAYWRFRDDYHISLGRNVHKRLNYPERTERIHGFRVFFSDALQKALDAEFGKPTGKIPYRLLGMAGISYCRLISAEHLPDYDEDKFYRWLDWFLLHAGELMRQVGLKDKAGRTRKNKRKI